MDQGIKSYKLVQLCGIVCFVLPIIAHGCHCPTNEPYIFSALYIMHNGNLFSQSHYLFPMARYAVKRDVKVKDYVAIVEHQPIHSNTV